MAGRDKEVDEPRWSANEFESNLFESQGSSYTVRDLILVYSTFGFSAKASST